MKKMISLALAIVMIATMVGCTEKVSNVEMPILTKEPTPTAVPTKAPKATAVPTIALTIPPTATPVVEPTVEPTAEPTKEPEPTGEEDGFEDYEPYFGQKWESFSECGIDWSILKQTDKYTEKDVYEFWKLFQYVMDVYSKALRNNTSIYDAEKEVMKYFAEGSTTYLLEHAKLVREKFPEQFFMIFIQPVDVEYNSAKDKAILKFDFIPIPSRDAKTVKKYLLFDNLDYNMIEIVQTADGWKLDTNSYNMY